MNRQYIIDSKEIREWFWTFVMSIGVVIAANVTVRVVPDFKDAQLVVFGFSLFMAALLSFGIPTILEYRFEKISIGKDSLTVFYRWAGPEQIRFFEIDKVVWAGRFGQTCFYTADKRMVVPMLLFSAEDRLEIIKDLRKRLPADSEVDWPEYCRNTAIKTFFLANGLTALGKPWPQPKPAPEFEQVHLTREESIAGTWKACKVLNLILVGMVFLALGAEWLQHWNAGWGFAGKMLLAGLVMAGLVTLIIWSVSAVFCFLTPREGRVIKRKVKLQTDEDAQTDDGVYRLTPTELLWIVGAAIPLASLCAWLFYAGFHYGIGFNHKETAIAAFGVFLLAYVATAVAGAVWFDKPQMEIDEAVEKWEAEVTGTMLR